MSETHKITLEADYKKVEKKDFDAAWVDSKKLAEKAVKKDDYQKKFKENFEKISDTEKLINLCNDLKDQNKKTDALKTINTKLNESFTIVEKTVDEKEMIAFQMNEKDKEFTLIGKDDFHSLFTDMVNDLYKDCWWDEFETEISWTKTEEFKLNDDVVIWWTTLKNMKTPVEVPTNPAPPVNPWNPWEGKWFFASISKKLKNWWGKIRDTLSKKAAEKKWAWWMLAGFWTWVDSFMNGETWKRVQAFLKDMGEVTSEIASVTDEVENTVAEVTDPKAPAATTAPATAPTAAPVAT
jgi:hypothetical protein